MGFVEIKSKLESFDLVRENFSKLGVWLEDKETKLDSGIIREKYGYKQFKIFLEENQGNKTIEIKREFVSESEKERAENSCKDLLNFLVQDTFVNN
jgi:hypothetical protein